LIDAMQFSTRKRRQAPTIIIVSLIDVLIVVLIFLMATTTFKQLPAIQLALPESKQAKPGAADNALVLSVPKQGPLYLKTDPITMDSLQQRLIEAVRLNPQTTLAIRADTDTPVGMLVKVMDAAKAANIKVASVFTRTAQ
jgi:biopolymer transport protein ExbD